MVRINNPLDKFNLNPNSKLFSSKNKEDLEGKTYYAYLDSVERINRKYHIRFDCIIKTEADNISINKETILQFPSIVLDIVGSEETIRSKFNYYNLHLLESSWMLLQTSLKDTEIEQQQYFNFETVGSEQSIGSYDIESVILYRNMDSNSQNKVNEIRNATVLEESTVTDVSRFLNNINLNRFSHVNVYNVGQGNCIGLVDINNKPLLYNDVGGGSGANQSTYPKLFKLCTEDNPPVILSHWDLDHIITAAFNDEILNSKWLVPKQQSLSNTAIHIALELQNRGNLICWNNTMTYHDFNGHRISKCDGAPRHKNNSGLALFVKYDDEKFVLLPGDANYNKISNYPSNKIIGMIASHHGSKGAIAGMPTAIKDSMLVYSYGYNNTHKHPTARNSYNLKGWTNFKDTIKGNIAVKQGFKNLAIMCGKKCSLKVDEQF